MKIAGIIAVLLLTAVGCSTVSTSSDETINAKYSEAKRISLEQFENPEVQEYNNSTLPDFWTRTMNRLMGKCRLGSGGAVSLVVTMNEQGVIQDVVGSPWNKKSQCLASTLTGLKAPAPPIYPYYGGLDIQ